MPETPGQKIKRQVAAIYAQGGTDEDVEAFLSSHPEVAPLNQPKPHKKPAPNTVNGNEIVDASPEPSYAQEALGGIASLLSDIPGATGVAAHARALVRRQPYEEALSDIQGGINSAPKAVRRANDLIGGTVAAAVTPGNGVAQAFRYGMLNGLLNPDPNATLSDRLKGGTIEGVVAGGTAHLGDALMTGVRGKFAPSLGKRVLARTAAMDAADKANYGRAIAEGNSALAHGPTPAVVQAALNAPDIKPYVEAVRASRTMQHANDAQILAEAYKLMSERQGMLQRGIVSSGDFKAGSSLEQADLRAAKKTLRNAASTIMPSFPQATKVHAELKGQLNALQTAADATRRIGIKSSVAGRKIVRNSPEAFEELLKGYTPEEAQAAKEGLLGRLKEGIQLRPNLISLGGTLTSAQAINRTAPYLSLLDQLTGNRVPSLLRAAAVSATTGGN